MPYTKRDFEAVARIIRTRHEVQIRTAADFPELHNTCRNRRMELGMVAEALSQHFAATNPRFDPERFARACEPGGGK